MSKPELVSVTPPKVLQQIHADLSLPDTGDPQTLVAEVMRRIAGTMCPCPPGALRRATVSALAPLSLLDALEDQVDDTFEDLVGTGDLIELTRVLVEGGENQPSWMFCSPPSFVRRSSGRIYIIGVAPDDAVFLPSELRKTMLRSGALRYFDDPEGACAKELRGIGLRELLPEAWLVQRRPVSAEAVVTQHLHLLEKNGVPGALDKAVILGGPNAGKSYRDRWMSPTNESGHFIVRVPQLYGEPLWYLSKLDLGVVQRSLLMPAQEAKERSSDAAWRLQLALDAAAGQPNAYKLAEIDGGYLMVFSFPLPLEARRRLTIVGSRRAQPGSGTTRFWIPKNELAEEQRFLRDSYWLFAKD
ncbi:hypothetical protein GHT07_04235 [Caenimonas koreensis DSM 17982]|uniref:Uncharacterized protein n=1 Tax=Caenimonas koreensis DSM 17982 TaxID=1121255 RepID=A0A844B7F4_9BURK|nr:hypothetical protein [Caenimonas koreensis]MRD46471.1 hypothetical protein [Caenimonas koreensis DSM 17982]